VGIFPDHENCAASASCIRIWWALEQLDRFHEAGTAGFDDVRADDGGKLDVHWDSGEILARDVRDVSAASQKHFGGICGQAVVTAALAEWSGRRSAGSMALSQRLDDRLNLVDDDCVDESLDFGLVDYLKGACLGLSSRDQLGSKTVPTSFYFLFAFGPVVSGAAAVSIAARFGRWYQTFCHAATSFLNALFARGFPSSFCERQRILAAREPPARIGSPWVLSGGLSETTGHD